MAMKHRTSKYIKISKEAYESNQVEGLSDEYFSVLLGRQIGLSMSKRLDDELQAFAIKRCKGSMIDRFLRHLLADADNRKQYQKSTGQLFHKLGTERVKLLFLQSPLVIKEYIMKVMTTGTDDAEEDVSFQDDPFAEEIFLSACEDYSPHNKLANRAFEYAAYHQRTLLLSACLSKISEEQWRDIFITMRSEGHSVFYQALRRLNSETERHFVGMVSLSILEQKRGSAIMKSIEERCALLRDCFNIVDGDQIRKIYERKTHARQY